MVVEQVEEEEEELVPEPAPAATSGKAATGKGRGRRRRTDGVPRGDDEKAEPVAAAEPDLLASEQDGSGSSDEEQGSILGSILRSAKNAVARAGRAAKSGAEAEGGTTDDDGEPVGWVFLGLYCQAVWAVLTCGAKSRPALSVSFLVGCARPLQLAHAYAPSFCAACRRGGGGTQPHSPPHRPQVHRRRRVRPRQPPSGKAQRACSTAGSRR
jgi:hypothetical protein